MAPTCGSRSIPVSYGRAGRRRGSPTRVVPSTSPALGEVRDHHFLSHIPVPAPVVHESRPRAIFPDGVRGIDATMSSDRGVLNVVWRSGARARTASWEGGSAGAGGTTGDVETH